MIDELHGFWGFSQLHTETDIKQLNGSKNTCIAQKENRKQKEYYTLFPFSKLSIFSALIVSVSATT